MPLSSHCPLDHGFSLILIRIRPWEKIGILFAVTTWWLWKWRNKRCFEDPEFRQSQAAAFIKMQATEIIRAFAEPSKQEYLPKRSGYGEVLVH